MNASALRLFRLGGLFRPVSAVYKRLLSGRQPAYKHHISFCSYVRRGKTLLLESFIFQKNDTSVFIKLA